MPSKPSLQNKEYKHVVDALKSNGYPTSIVKKQMREVRKPTERSPRNTDESSCRGFVTIPYIQGTTERLRRVLKEYNFKVAVKPNSKLADALLKSKDRVEPLSQTGVVYSIPCGECDVQYIGETGRALKTRMTEHERSVRLNKTKNSALADHSHSTGHSVSWDNAKVLSKEPKWSQRRWSEAWHIAATEAAICNRDRGRTLLEPYVPLVRKYS